MSKLKSLQKVDLPREKLAKYGPKKLKDEELLAILLGSGIKGKNVLELARSIIKLIKTVGTGNISLEEIRKIKGIGTTKATQVMAVIELSGRFSTAKPEILTPEDVWKLCIDFRGTKKEHLVAFYLDAQSKLIERQIITIGILDSNLIHPREVFEPAIKLQACSLIIVHNHPSGTTKTSASDKIITQRLISAGEILGIELADHVIVTDSGFSSFKNGDWE